MMGKIDADQWTFTEFKLVCGGTSTELTADHETCEQEFLGGTLERKMDRT